MALPTLPDVKAYLRVETTDEDVLITQLLARATADVEALLGYALTAVVRTHVDYSRPDNYGVQPRLTLPGPFKVTGPAPVVTDKDGVRVDASEYYLDDRGLRLLAKAGYSFPNRPYTIVATIGLSAHPDYAASLEAVASSAIIDLVTHRYEARDPSESLDSTIPHRVMQSIMLLPGASGLMLA